MTPSEVAVVVVMMRVRVVPKGRRAWIVFRPVMGFPIRLIAIHVASPCQRVYRGIRPRLSLSTGFM